MGKFLVSALVAIVGIHILVLLGALGYGLATKRFEKNKLKQYAAVWSGTELVEKPEETEQEETEEDPTDTMARIAEMEINSEVLLQNIQRQLELLQNMKTAVRLAQEELAKDRKNFDEEQQQFLAKVEEYEQKVTSDGFQRTLKSYSTMKPKYVKDDLLAMPEEEAVRYLSEMKPNVATSILSQFRTPEEQQARLKLMQQMQRYNSIAGDL